MDTSSRVLNFAVFRVFSWPSIRPTSLRLILGANFISVVPVPEGKAKLLLMLWVGMGLVAAARGQDVAADGSFALNGTVLERQGDVVLAVAYLNVNQINTGALDKDEFRAWLAGHGIWAQQKSNPSILDQIHAQIGRERQDLNQRRASYEESLLNWSETGIPVRQNWSELQKLYVHLCRRGKLFYVNDAPATLIPGKPFNLVATKIGQRTLDSPVPKFPFGPPLPLTAQIASMSPAGRNRASSTRGALLNRIVDGKLELMVYRPKPEIGK